MENSFSKYIIANVFTGGYEWMSIGLKEDFLTETFHRKDISMFKEDLIEIVKNVPEKLYYCVNEMVANVTCPPEVLHFVAEENFAKIRGGRNFIFKTYGRCRYILNSGIAGIALFDIIRNAPDDLLEKIFLEIESLPLLCLGQDQKKRLLIWMVRRDKEIPVEILSKLLKSEHKEVSSLAEIRLEKMGAHTEVKANELAHYKSLDLGV